MKLGINLGWKPMLFAGSSVAVGGISQIVIADATAVDPQSSIGASGSGWSAYVTLKGITSIVGTVDASKLTIEVSDTGYDTSGNVTTVLRTIKGVAHMRRQYPNGASKMINTDGVNVAMLVTLDDWIYSGTAIISATIDTGFYPASVVSTAPVKTNLSTQSYPTPLFAWINPQQESTGSTHSVEAVAFHRHARIGQQVACIKYSVTDGTNNSADVLVSTTTTSTKITQGYPPEVWAGTVDMSTMNQGVICTINAKIYPWIGTEYNVSVSGTAWPTSRNITPLRVHCDRTGAYGGGYAYVKVGASAGTVSATPATAQADPYPTITAALAGLRTWNNANKSHNDLGGGIIRLMDNGSGGAQTHTVATAPVNSPGDTWCTIEKDPGTGASISVTWSAQCAFPSLTRWRNVSIVPSVQTYNVLGPNTATGMVALDKCVVDNTANKTIVAWYNYVYLHNVTLAGGQPCNFAGLNRADYGLVINAGMVGTATSKLLSTLQHFSLTVGCYLPADIIGPTTSTQGSHGKIAHNNRLVGAVFTNSSATTLLDGLANVQNLYEQPTGGGVAMNFFADGDLTTVTNYIEMHNTAVGERASRMYNDAVACKVVPNGVQKIGVSRYSIWDNYNLKDDRFNTGAGSVGAWAYSYGVGNSGNVSLFGNVSRSTGDSPHNDNADTPYMGSAWLPSSEFNLGRTALGFTQAQIMAMFTNYTVGPKGSPVIGGNYIPLAGSIYLKNRVPVGLSVLKKDIAGAVRRTDGTGAAGAYESA